MIDPFTYWSRVMTGWRTIGETATRMEHTATDSRAIIASRCVTMGDALRSPWTADFGELSRMIPEKIAAFSLAGTALASAWGKMQADCVAEGQHVASVMVRGRAPTIAEMIDLSSRSTALGLRMFEASSRLWRDALAPIYRTVSSNAHRLNTRKAA